MIIVGRATGKFKGCPSGVLLPTLERRSIAGDLSRRWRRFKEESGSRRAHRQVDLTLATRLELPESARGI